MNDTLEIINQQEEIARMNEYYNNICLLDLTNIEAYLDLIDPNELLLFNYYLTWYKLDHGQNNIKKDELLCSLISGVLNNRLGPGFSRD